MLGKLMLSYDGGKTYKWYKKRYYDIASCKRMATQINNNNLSLGWQDNGNITNIKIEVFDILPLETLVIK